MTNSATPSATRSALCSTLLTASLLLGGPLAAQREGWSGTLERAEAMFSVWEQQRVAVLSVRYGPVAWPARKANPLRRKDHRVQLGAGSWARLETNVPMTLGGTLVEPGLYCLALQTDAEGGVSLVLLDDAAMRTRNVTAWHAPRLQDVGVTARLRTAWAEEDAGKLTIDLVVDPEQAGAATLRLRWGKAILTAPVRLDLTRIPETALGRGSVPPRAPKGA